VSIEKYLESGKIEQVIAGGENYDGARACNYDWVKSLNEAPRSLTGYQNKNFLVFNASIGVPAYRLAR
jgi:hypothetical protein